MTEPPAPRQTRPRGFCRAAHPAPRSPPRPLPAHSPSRNQSKRCVRLLFLLCSFAALSCSLQRLQLPGGPAPPAPGTAPGEVPGRHAVQFLSSSRNGKRNSTSQPRRAGSARTSAFLQGSFLLPARVWAGERNPELTLVVGSRRPKAPATRTLPGLEEQEEADGGCGCRLEPKAKLAGGCSPAREPSAFLHLPRDFSFSPAKAGIAPRLLRFRLPGAAQDPPRTTTALWGGLEAGSEAARCWHAQP